MADKLTLEDFYSKQLPEGTCEKYSQLSHMSHFNVFKRGVFQCVRNTQLHRTDFYKVSLIIGDGKYYYHDKVEEVKGQALIFSNPNVPATWVAASEKQGGYFCLFNDKFIEGTLNTGVFKNSALLDATVKPVFPLSRIESNFFMHFFIRMNDQLDADYEHKYEVILHYLNILIHEATRTRLAKANAAKSPNASLSITTKFMEILERQFPIDSSEQSINIKKPSDFAEQLSIHVNHLNRAVNETTGKSTTEIISSRVAGEAKALLKHTNNSVSEIAYTLGFEHPSNFNMFFKKHVELTPKAFRNLN